MIVNGNDILCFQLMIKKKTMATGTITQNMVNESFGLKRLLALTEQFVQEKINSAVDYAAETATANQDFNRS